MRSSHPHFRLQRAVYPAELVRLAKNRGLSVLAVTDHGTIAGVDEAQRVGNALGLIEIRGVELNTRKKANCHILGYDFRNGDTEPFRLCEKFRLREKGVDIDLSEVEKLRGEGASPRPHFAQVLVRGDVSTNREVFDRYPDTEEFRRRVKWFKADAKTCVEAIKSAE